ncbi:DUF3592 domain-containing protein [Roseinatronobacter alkalisoli]|uniref:DUF3592 domain-containing protein n=1 Tax=Roseinatronobacter alkalisoli TaxID=3028235 RepID=A0ABT5TB75_9RHOB|nr:DUF3592 domain-containing protein [Roseinatronobacter sp. HJB301]MDD7972367.1 DUF3592 domain-containing protein [Roseinatronobacter sp. HJB301]
MMDRGRGANSLHVRGLGNLVVLAFVMMIPLGFAGLGGWFILEEMRFSTRAVKVEATVIDSGRMAREDGDLFRPAFRFETPTGDIAEARTHIAASDYSFALHSTVTVLYNPDYPDQVRPHGFWMQYGFWAIFLGLGLVVFTALAWGIGSIMLLDRRARNTR